MTRFGLKMSKKNKNKVLKGCWCCCCKSDEDAKQVSLKV